MDQGQRIETTGPALLDAPRGASLETIERMMMSPTGPAVMRARVGARGDAPASTIYYFIRPQHIEAVLSDPKTFSLSPYDEALKAAAGDVRFMLGEPSKGQDIRRAMVRRVVGCPAHGANAPHGADATKGAQREAQKFDEWTERVRRTARLAASDCLASLRSSRRRGLRFNIIRDYGYFIPYLTAARVLGVPGPRSPSLLVRGFMLVRNLSNDWWVELSGEQARCQTMTAWSHLVMGHIFANFQSRNGLLKAAAAVASRELSAHIARTIECAEPHFETHLLARLLAERGSFPNLMPNEYEDHVRMILFEFVGAMIILVGISFGRILDVLARDEAPWARFPGLLSGPEGERVLEEALRLRTTTRSLLRRAQVRAEIGGVTLQPRDYACLLIGAQGAEPPFRERPGEDVRYLNFGLKGGPHACFGQRWARAILTEMVLALERAPHLGAVNASQGVREFAGAPDLFEMEWDCGRARDLLERLEEEGA